MAHLGKKLLVTFVDDNLHCKVTQIKATFSLGGTLIITTMIKLR